MRECEGVSEGCELGCVLIVNLTHSSYSSISMESSVSSSSVS